MRHVALLSTADDGACRHFSRYLDGAEIEYSHFHWDDIKESPRKTLASLADLIRGGASLYLREPAIRDLYDVAAQDALTSLLPYDANVIAPSRRSTNWCKPLHAQRLREILRDHGTVARVPQMTLRPSGADQGNSAVVKNVSAFPGEAFRWTRGLSRRTGQRGLELPLFLQPEVRGDEFRVHVVDQRVIALRLDRGAGTTGLDDGTPCPCEHVGLRDELRDACILLTRSEGLRFSGIDLIIDRMGTAWVLEVNPMPGYHVYEQALCTQERPISKALASALGEARVPN